jgi:hypothetical protein
MFPPPGKVIMFCGSDLGDAEDCVQWAGDAVCEGHDTPSLWILAGLLPPLNPFEVRDYATRALQELDIAIPSGSDAVSAFARDLIAEIITAPARMQAHLARLCSLCMAQDYQRDIYDFYLLRWAYDDLQREPSQFYWPGADRSNIRDIVLEKCRTWLLDYDTPPRANDAW